MKVIIGTYYKDNKLQNSSTQLPTSIYNSVVQTIDIYKVDTSLSVEQLVKLTSLLINPIFQEGFIISNTKPFPCNRNFNHAIEIGFLPCVTDNVANTVKQLLREHFNYCFQLHEGVYTAKLFLVQSKVEFNSIKDSVKSVYNPLIQYCTVTTQKDFLDKQCFPEYIQSTEKISSKKITLNVHDKELCEISRRMSLALPLICMKAIKNYFIQLQRDPFDVELYTLAQTWSEHCKHNIFNAPIDDIKEGLYKRYIKRATQEIIATGNNICVSVFSDNAGAIVFDENWLVVQKVETHNSPSALDPFGGASTGIVGVNRDILGFGKGAKPILNSYGFCFADREIKLFRDKGLTTPTLTNKQIIEGVIAGVGFGGNCSGIPTTQGCAFFAPGFLAKPLIFVGTIGLIPRKIAGHEGHCKRVQPGDCIVMFGGRVGKDGIHGATVSSSSLKQSNALATVVQIADPITQKKLSDALIKEIRDLNLYNAITDNGAGGLSSSVGEMGENGFVVHLEKVPTKYPNLLPWEIWISESQERMTLAVPPNNFTQLHEIAAKHGVEATIIGYFNNSGKGVVKYYDEIVMNMDMNFLHNQRPVIPLTSHQPLQYSLPDKSFQQKPLQQELLEMFARPNICARRYIAQQYDHEVQGTSVLKPLQGEGRVYSEVTVARPLLCSKKGIVQAYGCRYGIQDSYHMAAQAIDNAIKGAVSAGANIHHLALLDNFCWSNSYDETSLWQLKRAAQGCYDYAVGFGTPFISGKDSMFNEFTGYDEYGKSITLYNSLTLLITALGVIPNIEQSIALNAKYPEDLLYVLGETYDELGDTEYRAYSGYGKNHTPEVHCRKAKKLYERYHQAVQEQVIASAIPISFGGIAIALCKKLLAGNLGAAIVLPTTNNLDYRQWLFSESASRLLVTIAPRDKKDFENIMYGIACTDIGRITTNRRLVIDELCNISIDELRDSYNTNIFSDS